MNPLPENNAPGTPRTFAYGLEVVLALVVIAALAVIMLFEGEGLKRIWRQVAAPFAFTPVTPVSGDVRNIVRGEDNALWVLSNYSLLRFSSNRKPQQKTILNGPRYHEAFEQPMNALSAFQVLGRDEVWVGGLEGELLHYQEGVWLQVSHKTGPIPGRILALAAAIDEAFVGGEFGIWRWSVIHETLVPIVDTPPGTVTAMAFDADGNLLAAIENELWRYTHRRWQRLWTGRQIRSINMIQPRGFGLWLLGTDDGAVMLDNDGTELSRTVQGYNVMSAIDVNNVLWLATRGNGLLAVTDDTATKIDVLFRKPNLNLLDATLDTRGRLWVAAAGEGAFYASVEDLAELYDIGMAGGGP